MQALGERIWSELARACETREHAWRLPVLATLGLDGTPHARVVVLRRADPGLQQLVFFTDARTPKVAELSAQPRAALVFWCPRLRWQLRVAVTTRCITEGSAVDSLWERLRGSRAARDYLSTAAPGSPALAAPEPLPGDRHALCVVECEVLSVDSLALDEGGAHERVLLAGGHIQPLVP